MNGHFNGKIVLGRGLDLTGPEYEPVTSSCELGNEDSVFLQKAGNLTWWTSVTFSRKNLLHKFSL
jgi:hypothetical protein